MLTTGDMIQNRYRIVSLLGQGGMGAVYRAWDTRLNIPLALKEMTPQAGLDANTLAQLRQQFQQEAAVLARLNHSHLVRVTDFFEEGDNTYLVMDFVDGENLADRIARQGPMPEADVLTWADQLLDALDYCHNQGVLHRDVKPQNVVIRPDGDAVLVDFGLVKLWDPSDPRTKTAMRGMGTPEYAPPEQYEADAGHTDPRSDVYGVGATLYHALTGQAPPTATLRMADPNRFIPLRGLIPSVRPETEAAILKAMELPRSQRWQSAQEMARAMSGQTFAPARPPITPQYEKTKVLPGAQPAAPARKRRVPGWVWAVGGLAVILLCGAALALGGITIRQTQIAATAQARTTITAAAQAQATAIAQQVIQATATAQSQATATAQAAQATATAQSQATQATATARAHATATAEASIDAPPPEAARWPLLFLDTFSSAGNDWTIGDYSDELIEGNRRITGDKYHWQATASGGVVWWSMPDLDTLSDFYLTVEGQQISGDTDTQYGLILRRADSDNYYIFRIRDDGDYQFRVRHEGEWNTLINWTASPLIRPGQMNRLAIVAEGSNFVFYINDQYVADYTDSKVSEGKIALVIGFDDEGDTGVLEFDNFEVHAPAATALLPLLLSDDFDADENDWRTGDYSDERITGNRSIASGKYRWEANALDGAVWWSVPDIASVSDMRLTVDARRVSGIEDTRYGVVIGRVDNDNYGFFQVKDSQFFKFSVRYEGEWDTVLAWTEAPSIRPGKVNQIKIIVTGSHYAFYINDQLVSECDDGRLSRGQAGLAIELDKGDAAVFEFDNFEVRAP